MIVNPTFRPGAPPVGGVYEVIMADGEVRRAEWEITADSEGGAWEQACYHERRRSGPYCTAIDAVCDVRGWRELREP